MIRRVARALRRGEVIRVSSWARSFEKDSEVVRGALEDVRDETDGLIRVTANVYLFAPASPEARTETYEELMRRTSSWRDTDTATVEVTGELVEDAEYEIQSPF